MTVVRFIPLFLLGVALSLPMLGDKQIFFEASPVDACRIIYPESPFTESIRIADYLRQHTSPDDTIAVLGSEPQIYFYSSRHSATGYIYTYGLMEPQKYAQQMQQEMIREIERHFSKVSGLRGNAFIPGWGVRSLTGRFLLGQTNTRHKTILLQVS